MNNKGYPCIKTSEMKPIQPPQKTLLPDDHISCACGTTDFSAPAEVPQEFFSAPAQGLSAPSNLRPYCAFPWGTIMRFDAEFEGIDWFYYKIWEEGRDGDEEYLLFQVIRSTDRNTYRKLEHQLNLQNPGGRIRYEIYSVKGDERSPSVYSDWVSTKPVEMAADDNEFKVEFVTGYGFDADGNIDPNGAWTTEEVIELKAITRNCQPIVKDLQGNNWINLPVLVFKDQRYTGTNIYNPTSHFIAMSKFAGLRIYFHELFHAHSTEPQGQVDGRFTSKLASFFESRAEGLAFFALNLYRKLYGNNLVRYFGNTSELSFDVDFRNVPELTTEDFWSDTGGMLLNVERYRVGAAAIEKLERTVPGIHRLYLKRFADFINNKETSFSGINKHFYQVASEVLIEGEGIASWLIEGQRILPWLNEKTIFDASIIPGEKIFNRSDRHLDSYEYAEKNRFYFYETFEGGSDWFEDGKWYSGNGAKGRIRVYNNPGNHIASKILEVTPILNPPDLHEYGYAEFNISSQKESQRFQNHFVIEEFGLYQLEVKLGTQERIYYRLYGKKMENLEGIAGGIIGASSGKIEIDHSHFEIIEIFDVNNGAFAGKTEFAVVYDHKSKQTKSIPGEVTFRFVNDADGLTYIAKRMISYGDYRGNQLFLFDLNEMEVELATPITETNWEDKYKSLLRRFKILVEDEETSA